MKTSLYVDFKILIAKRSDYTNKINQGLEYLQKECAAFRTWVK